jgi:hypothetical protein
VRVKFPLLGLEEVRRSYEPFHAAFITPFCPPYLKGETNEHVLVVIITNAGL